MSLNYKRLREKKFHFKERGKALTMYWLLQIWYTDGNVNLYFSFLYTKALSSCTETVKSAYVLSRMIEVTYQHNAKRMAAPSHNL